MRLLDNVDAERRGLLPGVIDLIVIRDLATEFLLAQSDSPWERILGILSQTQKQLFREQEYRVDQILRAYREAREVLQREFDAIWARTIGEGKRPEPADVVRMLQSAEVARSIDERLAHIQAVAEEEIRRGIERAEQIEAGGLVKEFGVIIDSVGVRERVDPSTFGHIDPVAHELTIQTAVMDTRNLTDYSRNRIISELRTGAMLGEGVLDLKRRFQALEDVGRTRAELITRWAVIKGPNMARQLQYERAKEYLPALKKMWMAQLDNRTCELCAALHGSIVEVEGQFDWQRTFGRREAPQPFEGQLITPPRHPRCRCTVVGWMESWRVGTAMTPEEMERRAREWAERNGMVPRTFGTDQMSSAAARIEDARAYLAKGALASDDKILRAFQEELDALTQVKTLPYQVRHTAARVRTMLESQRGWARAQTTVQKAIENLDVAGIKAAVKAASGLKFTKAQKEAFDAWVKSLEATINEVGYKVLSPAVRGMLELPPNLTGGTASLLKDYQLLTAPESGYMKTSVYWQERINELRSAYEKKLTERAMGYIEQGLAAYSPESMVQASIDWLVKIHDVLPVPEVAEGIKALKARQVKLQFQKELLGKTSAELSLLVKKQVPAVKHPAWLTKDQKIKVLVDPESLEAKELIELANQKQAEYVKEYSAKKKAEKKVAAVVEPKAPPPPANETQVVVEVKPLPAPTPEEVYHVPVRFTKAGQQPSLAGAHEKFVLEDELGNRWLFKPMDRWLAEGESQANAVLRWLGFPAADVRVVQFEGRWGSAARWLDDVAGDLLGVLPSQLTAAELRELQRHQVIDWLISNHDSHAQNFLRLRDGRLVAIDKGQALKALGRDQLNTVYRGGVENPYYNEMWEAYVRREVELDLHAIDDLLDAIDAIDDEAFVRLFAGYIKGRPAASFGLTGARNADEFAELLKRRKRELRDDFARFYSDLAKRRGVTYEPPVRRKVEELVYTPIDEKFVASLERVGPLGKPVFVAGHEVEGGEVLFWEELDDKGHKVLRVSLKTQAAGDAAVTRRLSALVQGTSAEVQYLAEDEGIWNECLALVKHINYHVSCGDFAFKKEKLDALSTVKEMARRLVESGEKMGRTELKQAAAYYLQMVRDIETALKNKTVIPTISRYVPASKLVGAEAAATGTERIKNVTRTENMHREMEIDWERGVFKWSGRQQKIEGRVYQGQIGDDAWFSYRPWKDTPLAEQGLLELTVKDYTAENKVEKVRRVLEALQEVGLTELRSATREDMELLYWRMLRGSCEQSMDASKYQAALRVLDQALGAATTVKEEIQAYKEAFSLVWGREVVEKADWRPRYYRNWNGERVGHPFWIRPDIGTGEQLKQYVKGRLLNHAFYSGSNLVDVILPSGFLMSTRDRVRVGLSLQRAKGMSSYTDIGTGGASYVFTRLWIRQKSEAEVLLNPSLLRQVSTVVYDHDLYGRVEYRQQYRRFDPHQWGEVTKYVSNETLLKGQVGLFDTMEILLVPDETTRTEIIKWFESKGIRELRGVPIEERIMVNSYDAENAINEFLKKHSKKVWDYIPGEAAD